MGYSIAHVNNRNGLIAMCVIFTVFSTTAVILRFYARKVKGLRFQIDDWLSVVSLVFVIALNGMFLAGCVEHVITGHSPVVNNWPVTTEKEHIAQKYKYGFQTTEKIGFGIIKLSILFLWRRIFGHVRAFNISSWVMIGIVSAWSLAFFFATLFQCGNDWKLNWAPIGIFLTQCTDTLDMLTVFATTDIVTDLLIIAMPIPMIWSLQMSVRRKIAINAMFLVGLFAIGAGIARTFVYLTTSYEKSFNPDFIQDLTIFLLWSLIELNLAMICSCLPTLLPIATKIPHVHQIYDSSKRLLSFSWMRSSRRSLGSLDSGKDSSSSGKNFYVNDKAMDSPHPQISQPYLETEISTASQEGDVEMQKPSYREIMVRRDISHHHMHAF